MKGALRGHFELEIFEVFALDPAFVGFDLGSSSECFKLGNRRPK